MCPQIWWLEPELTYGRTKPFVFTQGHSVCNRSFFPCFDTPAVKCTYSAVVKVGALGSSSKWGCGWGRGWAGSHLGPTHPGAIRGAGADERHTEHLRGG